MTKPLRDGTVAELFDAYSQALQLYARQWVGAAEADDVVQRVFVRLLSSGRKSARRIPFINPPQM